MLQSVEPTDSENKAPVDYGELPAQKTAVGRARLVAKAILQAVLALVVLFVAFKGMDYLVNTKPEVPKRPITEKSYAVETEAVAQKDYTPLINVYGEVTAGRQVDLRSLVAGEVVSVSDQLKAGGIVSKGDVLVSIDRFEYEGALTEAEANLAEAKAGLIENRGRVELEKANVVRAREQLEFAQKDLERAQDLLKRGSVTERTADDRKLLVSQRQQIMEQRLNALALEQANVEQQEAVIERLNWRLEDARRKLANTVLKAPFDAVVRTEGAQIGRLTNANDVVASIYSRDELEVRFTLSDNQYGRLVAENGTVVGRPVEVMWYLGNQPLTYMAVVDRVGADVASSRGGVDVFARISVTPEKTPLRPGAFVEVSVPDKTYSGSFRIPETAFYGDGLVYVVDSESRLAERQVKPLAFDNGYIIVQGDLKDGETILATRIPEAGTGLLVRPVGGDAKAAAAPPASASN
ncbi:efflux RND transporter periplasmic adaptor subunit [Roseibium algae]|uniref:HlyD family efflux transporter periplasmic adaptor subunit n=1 Tax=Roseibium algae TaxID=3123038 RepID=A0ABU8TGU5_9HYPH